MLGALRVIFFANNVLAKKKYRAETYLTVIIESNINFMQNLLALLVPPLL